MRYWKSLATKVLKSKIPYRVFYFEDLVSNPIKTVKEMVEFLANPALHPENLNERLACLSQQLVGDNKRKSSKINFDPFTNEMKKFLNSEINELRKVLSEMGVKKVLPSYEISVKTVW